MSWRKHNCQRWDQTKCLFKDPFQSSYCFHINGCAQERAFHRPSSSSQGESKHLAPTAVETASVPWNPKISLAYSTGFLLKRLLSLLRSHFKLQLVPKTILFPQLYIFKKHLSFSYIHYILLYVLFYHLSLLICEFWECRYLFLIH